MAVGASIGMKLIGIVVSIPVGMVTKKVVERVWLSARPNDPPRKASERDVRIADAVGWAALSASAVVARELITRRSSEAAFRTITGSEPPPPRKTRAEKKLEKAADKIDLDKVSKD